MLRSWNKGFFHLHLHVFIPFYLYNTSELIILLLLLFEFFSPRVGFSRLQNSLPKEMLLRSMSLDLERINSWNFMKERYICQPSFLCMQNCTDGLSNQESSRTSAICQRYSSMHHIQFITSLCWGKNWLYYLLKQLGPAVAVVNDVPFIYPFPTS